MSGFIHLRLHTAWSLAEGAIRTDWLAKTCQKFAMPAVGITDSNNLYGAMESATVLADAGVQPIIGAEIDVLSPALSPSYYTPDKIAHRLVLLAATEAGYHNLIKLITAAHFADPPKACPGLGPHLQFDDLTADSCSGLVCLSGGKDGNIASALHAGLTEQAADFASQLQLIFGDRFYMELNRFPDLENSATQLLEKTTIDLADSLHIPLVATNACMFSTPDMYDAHDALLCITGDHRIGDKDRPYAARSQYVRSPQDMQSLFSDLPDACENTLEIARRCQWWPKPVKTLLLPSFTKGINTQNDTTDTEDETLKRLAKEGLVSRLEDEVLTSDMSSKQVEETRKHYFERLESECDVIIHMKYSGYFLIVADFIGWALDHGIPVGPGRGSGVGSIVAWALRITNLDPIRYGLLFERFLNKERVSMPDFDVDFCQQRRDEVLRYVRETYGDRQVAQIATFGSLQAKAVVRDLGRILELPSGLVNTLANLIPFRAQPPVTLKEAISDVPRLKEFIEQDSDVARLFDYALKLEGLYRHSSTHAAGVVIGDRPLEELVPLTRDPKTGAAATQYNMKWVEKIGLVKFDFLGLKTLSVIEMAVQLAKKWERIDKHLKANDIPINDRKALDLIQNAETVGVFQFESSGMQNLLRQIKINSIDELIALVSLYRPGPMQNIPKYVENSAAVARGEAVGSIHPLLDDALRETHGIMIYQEQVLEAVRNLAGYTLGEADVLRRAMGKKNVAEMANQLARFIKGTHSKSNLSEAEAKQVFETIEKFAGYGFNKSHAAAYAVMSSQTAWLKAHHPHAFYAASMSFDLQSTDRLADFVQDMKRRGFVILPPDVNRSEALFSIEKTYGEIGKDGQENTEVYAIRYALAAIKGIGESVANSIVEARETGGMFTSLFDLCDRVPSEHISKRSIEPLASSGALDGIITERAQAFESAELLSRYAQSCTNERESAVGNLFENDDSNISLPPLSNARPWSNQDKLEAEFGALGFYLTGHPLDEDADLLKNCRVVPLARFHTPDAPQEKGGSRIAARIESVRQIHSQRGRPMLILNLSDPSGALETRWFQKDDRDSELDTDDLKKGRKITALLSFNDEGNKERRFELINISPFESLRDISPHKSKYVNRPTQDQTWRQSQRQASNCMHTSPATVTSKPQQNSAQKLDEKNQALPCHHLCLEEGEASARNLAGWLADRRADSSEMTDLCRVVIEISFRDKPALSLSLPDTFSISQSHLATLKTDFKVCLKAGS